MANRKLNKDTSDKISFVSFIIPEFALAYKMNVQKAYQYLKQYGGIDYLNKHWWALHNDYNLKRKNYGNISDTNKRKDIAW